MAELMVRYDDLRRYCEKRHCGSVPLEYIKQMQTIAAEITAPPKSNADRIRQMTDEELVKSIGLACKRCAYYKVGRGECSGQDKECTDGNLEWLKQDVKKDAKSDTEEP